MNKNIFLIISLLLSTNLFIHPADDGGVPEGKSSDPVDDDLFEEAKALTTQKAEYPSKGVALQTKEFLFLERGKEEDLVHLTQEELKSFNSRLLDDRLKGPSGEQDSEGREIFPLPLIKKEVLEKLIALTKQQDEAGWKSLMSIDLAVDIFNAFNFFDIQNEPLRKYLEQFILDNVFHIFKDTKLSEIAVPDLYKWLLLALNQKLIRASRHGKIERVRALLNRGADVNAVDGYDGARALIEASQNGHPGVVDQLLRAGADVNVAGGDDGNRALIEASKYGYAGIVDQLLEARADVNAVDGYDGTTALIWASQYGHAGMVDQLLRAGADVNLAGGYDQTALILASKNGHDGIVDQLLRAGADVNVVDRYYQTALIWASQRGHADIVALLRAHGAR